MKNLFPTWVELFHSQQITTTQQQQHARSINRDNKSIPEANVLNSYVS